MRNLGEISTGVVDYNPSISSAVRPAAHPGGDGLADALSEGTAESAVTAVAALDGQLLHGEGLLGGSDLLVAADEVVDAQVIDISAVGDALT